MFKNKEKFIDNEIGGVGTTDGVIFSREGSAPPPEPIPDGRRRLNRSIKVEKSASTPLKWTLFYLVILIINFIFFIVILKFLYFIFTKIVAESLINYTDQSDTGSVLVYIFIAAIKLISLIFILNFLRYFF
jgi:hypothetical protein